MLAPHAVCSAQHVTPNPKLPVAGGAAVPEDLWCFSLYLPTRGSAVNCRGDILIRQSVGHFAEWLRQGDYCEAGKPLEYGLDDIRLGACLRGIVGISKHIPV